MHNSERVLKSRGGVCIVYSMDICKKEILSSAIVHTTSLDTLDVKFRGRIQQYGEILVLNLLLSPSLRRHASILV